jgi:hypothetical protein
MNVKMHRDTHAHTHTHNTAAIRNFLGAKGEFFEFKVNFLRNIS